MKKNGLWGCLCILCALLILGNQFGLISFKLSLWKIIGTIICISIFLSGIRSRDFYGPFFALAILFSIFSKDLGFTNISLWTLLVAAWLLGWGCTSIFHPRKKHIEIHSENIEYTSNSIINISSTFGEKVQYIQTNDLQYVTIDSKFSGLKVYFDQAQIQNQATVEIDATFTGIELYIPKEWNVQSNVRAMFGGVDTKGQPKSNGYPTLTIQGNVTFGGIEIHYI